MKLLFLCVYRHRRPHITEEEDQECIINFGNESEGLDTVALRRVVLQQALTSPLDDGRNPLQTVDEDSGTDQHSGTDHSGESESSSEDHQHGATTMREEDGPAEREGHDQSTESPGSKNSSSSSAEHAAVKTPASIQNQEGDRSGGRSSPRSLESSGDGREAGGRESGQPAAGVGSRDAATEGPERDSKTGERKGTPAPAPGGDDSPSSVQNVAAVHTSQAESVEEADTRAEDPVPDYQKRVSFSRVLDDAENAQTTDATDGPAAKQEKAEDHAATARLLQELTARVPDDFVNPAFEDEIVVDGWSEDYGNYDLPTHRMSTVL